MVGRLSSERPLYPACCLKCFCVVPWGKEEGNLSLTGTGGCSEVAFFLSSFVVVWHFFLFLLKETRLQEAGAAAPVPGSGRAEARRGGGVGGGQPGCGLLGPAPPSPAQKP